MSRSSRRWLRFLSCAERGQGTWAGRGWKGRAAVTRDGGARCGSSPDCAPGLRIHPNQGTVMRISRRIAAILLSGALWLPPVGAPTSLYAALRQEPRAQAAQLRPLAVQDLLALRRVGSPAISPDGEWVAYTVTTVLEKQDRS